MLNSDELIDYGVQIEWNSLFLKLNCKPDG